MMVKKSAYLYLTVMFMLVGCGGGSEEETASINDSQPPVNTLPTLPDTTEPATTEPDTTEPVTTEPDTTEPVTTEPNTTEPDTTEPNTTEPDTIEPDSPSAEIPIEATYTAPASANIYANSAMRLSSDIVWHNENEITSYVDWTGSGAVHLDDTTSLTPLFNAPAVGEYSLTQTIVSNLHNTVSQDITITVAAKLQSEIVNFTPPSEVTVGTNKNFTFNSNVEWLQSTETTQSILWEGDGAVYLNDTQLLNPTFNAKNIGQYNLKQTITSSAGYVLETTIVVTVKNYEFSEITGVSIAQGTEYKFTSAIIWNNGTENTASVAWTGDNTSYLSDTTVLNPTFSANDIGLYTYTQTIVSSHGQTFETKVNIAVHNPDIQAARVLQQSTFGPSIAMIEDVKTMGYESWLDAQIALAPSKHMDILVHKRNEKWRWQAWSDRSTYAPDQVKQRLGFALSEIMTVSYKAIPILYNYQAGMTDYYDQLVEHSVGNFRDLLEVVTRHPVMGIYLTYMGNNAGERPDENYAREIMQLFTIGLVELNMDGTPKLDANGHTIPTYNQTTVEQFAKVFTGLCFPKPMNNRYCNRFPEGGTFELPMVFWEDWHDKGEKKLLNGLVLPANQSADKDLKDALDNLAYHPNTAPFISTLLIKRLVTSNPTPEYVERVATVFANSGGDLALVAKAIFLDKEAIEGQHSNSFGKLREPLLKMTHLFRSLDAHMPNVGQYRFGNKTAFYDIFGQAPFYSPSVFNFFMPDYSQGVIKEANLVAPEFQILTPSQLLVTENKFFEFIFNPAVHYPNIHLNILQDVYTEKGVEALLEKINILFTSGLMTESMKTTIRNQVAHMVQQNVDASYITKNVLLFVMHSPEFAIQR